MMEITRARVGSDMVGVRGRFGMRARIVDRSDIVAWRLCSVTGGAKRGDDLHRLQAIAGNNNNGTQYLRIWS